MSFAQSDTGGPEPPGRKRRLPGTWRHPGEGSLSDVVVTGRKLHANSIMGTLAAWTLRFCPFVFAGGQRLAADFAWRLLASQLPSDERRRALLSPAGARSNSLAGLESPAVAKVEDCAPPF
jgi:hypothetical protein